jgi:hypothetical protein
MTGCHQLKALDRLPVPLLFVVVVLLGGSEVRGPAAVEVHRPEQGDCEHDDDGGENLEHDQKLMYDPQQQVQHSLLNLVDKVVVDDDDRRRLGLLNDDGHLLTIVVPCEVRAECRGEQTADCHAS